MFDLQPIIARIKEKCGKDFRVIDGAASYAKLETTTPSFPCVYVVREDDHATQAGDHQIILKVNVAVMVGVSNQQSREGRHADADLFARRVLLFKALHGSSYNEPTTDPSTVRALKFLGGKPLQYTDQHLWWVDKYSFETPMDSFNTDPTLSDPTLNHLEKS